MIRARPGRTMGAMLTIVLREFFSDARDSERLVVSGCWKLIRYD